MKNNLELNIMTMKFLKKKKIKIKYIYYDYVDDKHFMIISMTKTLELNSMIMLMTNIS